MSTPADLPGPSAEDLEGFRRFSELLERIRDRVDEEVLEAARRIPAFAAALESQGVEEDEERRRRSREREREALVHGRWEPFLEHLAEQGATYARLGIDFRDWYALLSPYRRVLYGHLLADDVEKWRIFQAMDRFLDTAMATIGSVYLETKEELVRQAESRLSLYIEMFADASVGMLIYEWEDPPDLGSFRLLAANPAASEMAGLRVLDQVGLTLHEASPQLLDTEIPKHYAAAVEQQQRRSWQVERGSGADERTYFSRCFPLHGRYLGVLFEDITERQALQRRLQQQVRELERSNRELDDFAYVASHDLKAPLRDIDNLVQWLTEDLGDGLEGESERHFQLLRERVGRMERLLDDLLQYSRAGRKFPEPEEVAVRDVLEEALGVVPAPPGFQVGVHGDDPRITSARPPLALVARNLVSNAIKHHDRDRGQIDIEVADAGEVVRCSVSDDGPGVPADLRDRVFRLFQTLRPRDEVEGSGMGLAIVKKVVEAHGGEVWLEGRDPRGTTITFTWPKSSSASEQTSREP